jgi:hypothetical protein
MIADTLFEACSVRDPFPDPGTAEVGVQTQRETTEASAGFVDKGEVAACDLLIGHSDFPRAARALAVNMLAVSDADPTLGSVFTDAGRYITAMLVGYLHGSGGMTLPRLKDACASSGFLSPGRARTLLQFLRHIGYIELVRQDGGARAGTPETYRATPRFFAAWRAHARAALLAAAIAEPAVVALADRLDEPGVFETFLHVQASRLHHGAGTVDQSVPIIRIFLQRYAGTQMLWTLIEAGDESNFPAAGPIPVSLGGASRRFGVSHIHIRRLLNDARAEGLLRYEGRGTVTLEENTRRAVRYLYAIQLVELIAAAHATLTALQQPVAA